MPKGKETSLTNILEQAGLIDSASSPLSEHIDRERAQKSEDLTPVKETVEKEEILAALAEQFGMEVISNLNKIIPDPDLMNLLPKEIMLNHKIFPVNRNEENLVVVVVADPNDVVGIDTVRMLLEDQGVSHKFALASSDEIEKRLDLYFSGADSEVEKMLEDMAEAKEENSDGDKSSDDEYRAIIEDIDHDNDEAPIVRLVNLIIQDALRARASDIHFEPFEKSFIVRFRIDGVLQIVQTPPKNLEGSIITRLKIMSGMDLAEKRIPQDGRIMLKAQNRLIDFRVSALPSMYGESIVLRILDKEGVMLGLEQIGFLPAIIDKFMKIIRSPNGILLITGPTGSGKTTTLYSALNYLNNVDTKIITVEHPVEYQIDGINQVQVTPEIGLTFATGLRAILRQAPDVILVGEIRDTETAEIAVRSALTGHLVFSTLHTNDAPSAPTRLIDMGIKPYLIAASVQAIMAQRLVRKICPRCKEAYHPEPDEIASVGFNPEEYKQVPFYRGRGCDYCHGTGYRGRSAIAELLTISEEIKELIHTRSSADKIRQIGRQQGMLTLREDAWQKVLKGDTTILEVARVTESFEEDNLQV